MATDRAQVRATRLGSSATTYGAAVAGSRCGCDGWGWLGMVGGWWWWLVVMMVVVIDDCWWLMMIADCGWRFVDYRGCYCSICYSRVYFYTQPTKAIAPTKSRSITNSEKTCTWQERVITPEDYTAPFIGNRSFMYRISAPTTIKLVDQLRVMHSETLSCVPLRWWSHNHGSSVSTGYKQRTLDDAG